jgi:hypothetical protein
VELHGPSRLRKKQGLTAIAWLIPMAEARMSASSSSLLSGVAFDAG